ncbi:MAG: hypothetical protein QN187_02085 [Armatimonadota bacterium]|nr:hypothetical protein [Armatimonadota bacterium]
MEIADLQATVLAGGHHHPGAGCADLLGLRLAGPNQFGASHR